MKKLVYGIAIASAAICVGGGISGCQALEAAKNSVTATIAVSGLKSDIEKTCAGYESRGDGAGMKAYLLKLMNQNPKPDGWNATIESLVKEHLAKAEAILLKGAIQGKYDQCIAQGDAEGAKKYITSLLSAEKKPTGWDKSVEDLVKSLLEKINSEALKYRCNEIWNAVKAALDKRDFATARKLTSMARPYDDELLREDILCYRIGVLNEIVNPYQCDWIIHEMTAKVNELQKAGKPEAVRPYLESVQPIRDEFPSIYQKVKEVSPGLKNLYWLDERIAGYLKLHIEEAQTLLNARAVSGNYRDYKEVFDLVDAAVAEMKLYNPNREPNAADIAKWESSMKCVRRVMTTADVNDAIEQAKKELVPATK